MKKNNAVLIKDNGKGRITIKKTTSAVVDKEIKKALKGVKFEDVTHF